MEFTSSLNPNPIVLPDKWREWEVTDVLGRGSYGTVYSIVKNAGTDEEIRNALKIVRIPGEDDDVDELRREYRTQESLNAYYKNLSEEFSREIETMNLLKGNEYIVSIIDHEIVGLDSGYSIYIQMDLLTSLTDYFMMEPITEKEVIRIGIDIAKGLVACKDNRIIHRDIKPDNIFYNNSNFCLGDFGIARQVNPGQRTLSFKGSFSYMAPEIFHNEKYDARVDIYSLGLVLYRLMNKNKEPFIDPEKQLVYFKDKEEAMNKRMAGDSLTAPIEASDAFASVILKACEYAPADRYQKPEDFLRDLEILNSGSTRGLSVRKSKTKQKKTEKQKIMPWVVTVAILTGGLAATGVGLLMNSSDVKAIAYQIQDKRILNEDEALLARQAVESFDRLLWRSAVSGDYAEFQSEYPDADINACEGYYQLYNSVYTKEKYITVAQVKNEDTGEDQFCVTVIRYEETPSFPYYTGDLRYVGVEYTVQKDADGNWSITRLRDALRQKLNDYMPDDYRNAFQNQRHSRMFDSHACISESLEASDASEKEALFEGVIEPVLSAIWENDDDSIGMMVSVSNGSEKECYVNSLDIKVTDLQGNIVLEKMLESEDMQENRIASGEYLTFTNISVEDLEIPEQYWNAQLLFNIDWDIDWDSYERYNI